MGAKADTVVSTSAHASAARAREDSHEDESGASDVDDWASEDGYDTSSGEGRGVSD